MTSQDRTSHSPPRLTTDYSDAEDRFFLFAENDANSTIVVWLTQRLLRRLVVHLLQWIDQRSGPAETREIVHLFEQEVARASLIRQPYTSISVAPASTRQDTIRAFERDAMLDLVSQSRPVPSAQLQWTAAVVEITAAPDQLMMTFRASNNASLTLGLTRPDMRQWLVILYSLWVRAEWPQEIWPTWLAPQADAGQLHAGLH